MTVWKEIPGYPNYEVSDQGEVRNIETSRVRKLQHHRGGYSLVRLCHEGRWQDYTVHHLLMLAHCGERPDGYHICHLDGDPSNNVLSNLVYGTASENQRHSVQHGTQVGHKLNERKVRVIRGLYKLDYSVNRLSQMFGVNTTAIYRVIRRITYAWVD